MRYILKESEFVGMSSERTNTKFHYKIPKIITFHDFVEIYEKLIWYEFSSEIALFSSLSWPSRCINSVTDTIEVLKRYAVSISWRNLSSWEWAQRELIPNFITKSLKSSLFRILLKFMKYCNDMNFHHRLRNFRAYPDLLHVSTVLQTP